MRNARPSRGENKPMHTSRAMLSHSLAYVHGHVSPRRARVCRRLRGCRVLCDHSGAARQASTPLPGTHANADTSLAAYLLLTRAAPMRLHRRQARRRVRTAPASRAHTPACLTALRSNLFFAAKPPNHETLPPTAARKLPRWLRTFCSLAPHLCGFTAARHADVCAQLLRRARTHLRV